MQLIYEHAKESERLERARELKEKMAKRKRIRVPFIMPDLSRHPPSGQEVLE